uniref:Pre-C2HC domain-containing protein n=1 Tax=Phlebotomus papatasi TaxID=29031 RepID=A0A1B0DM52_PHLPP
MGKTQLQDVTAIHFYSSHDHFQKATADVIKPPEVNNGENDTSAVPQPRHEPAPPPIVVYGVEQITQLTRMLDSATTDGSLLHCLVQFEAPHVKKEIVQCKNCQYFGHTKSYCNRKPKCVKCAGNHLTEACLKVRNDGAAKCSNCNGDHPASYRGCVVHKELQKKMYPALRNRITTRAENFSPRDITPQTLRNRIKPPHQVAVEIPRSCGGWGCEVCVEELGIAERDDRKRRNAAAQEPLSDLHKSSHLLKPPRRLQMPKMTIKAQRRDNEIGTNYNQVMIL